MIHEKKEVRDKLVSKLEDEVSALRSTNSFFQCGQNAAEHFYESPVYKNADIILLFYPFGNEIPIFSILEQAWKDGKQVALPRTREEGEMDFYMLNAHDPLDEQLEKHPYGMYEPLAELPLFDQAENEDELSEEEIVALIPALAFTGEGVRLGRGKGYYDRFLERVEAIDITLVGTCFSFQIENELPYEPHDRNVTYLLTEKGLRQIEN